MYMHIVHIWSATFIGVEDMMLALAGSEISSSSVVLQLKHIIVNMTCTSTYCIITYEDTQHISS